MYEKQSSLKVFSTFGNEQEIGLNLSDSASMSLFVNLATAFIQTNIQMKIL
jgi:hypothetical protein